jgi:hypothetical protein
VLLRLGSQNLKEVEWLERRHEGHLGWYSYEGNVKITDWQGQERVSEYLVVVELNADDGWDVSSISVKWE